MPLGVGRVSVSCSLVGIRALGRGAAARSESEEFVEVGRLGPSRTTSVSGPAGTASLPSVRRGPSCACLPSPALQCPLQLLGSRSV